LNQRFVIFIPWLFLCLAGISALFVPFSHWAINAEVIGKNNMGAALFFSFSFPMAVYVSVGISVVSLVMAALYKSNDKKGSKILLLAALTGCLPIVYILWLDHGVNNAV
jgi:Na+/phosphate symporter